MDDDFYDDDETEKAQYEALRQARNAPLEEIKKQQGLVGVVLQFEKLDDEQFVEFIRWSHGPHADWWREEEWKVAVRIELDMRLLLKRKE